LPAISKHLKVLERAGLIARGREAQRRPCRLKAAPLREVWVALRANMRAVLESVTLADVAKGELPAEVLRLTEEPEVWEPR